MKTVFLLTILALLASCAPVPRAIIAPQQEVRVLDVAPVNKASQATRKAVRGISASLENNIRNTERVADDAQRIKDAVTKARAGAKEELEEAMAAVDAIVDDLIAKIGELQASLRLTAEARDAAIATVDEQEAAIGTLTRHASAQEAEIRAAKITESTLREQVTALSASDAKRIIAEDKLHWWKWRFLPASIGIVVFLLAGIAGLVLIIIYKPRIPFLP